MKQVFTVTTCSVIVAVLVEVALVLVSGWVVTIWRPTVATAIVMPFLSYAISSISGFLIMASAFRRYAILIGAIYSPVVLLLLVYVSLFASALFFGATI